MLTHAEKDEHLITLRTLLPFAKKTDEVIRYNSPDIKTKLNEEGLKFYNLLRNITINYMGKELKPIAGAGLANGWTMLIRKRPFSVFKWEDIGPKIEEALKESGFYLGGG